MSPSTQSLPKAESDQLFALFNDRRYSELEDRARNLVERYPDSGVAWKALGASLQMQGKNALPTLQKAAQLLPEDAAVQRNLGRELRGLGRLDEAVSHLHRALEIKPDFAEAHNDLGAALDDRGELKEAVACYRRALEIKPDFMLAHNNLGKSLHALGQTHAAEASFRRALELDPNFAEAHCNLGGAQLDLGQLTDATMSYRRAIEINPDFLPAHNRLGVVLRRLGQPDAAAESHRRALAIDPGSASAHNNLGIAFRDLGRLDTAMTSYRRALEIDPDFAPAYINLGGALEDLWQLDDAVACFRQALQIDTESLTVRSSLLSLQQYLPDVPAERLLAEARQFGDLVARQASAYGDWANIPDPARCLRVGLVSPDFRNHPVGYFLEGMLAALASRVAGRLEIVGYTTNIHTDEVTERIKACCNAWHTPLGVSDENLARQIREDGIDILIDLSGHTVHNRLSLFAWKPAPVQVSWLGYFATTGLAEMDYLIADPWTLPESDEACFTEKIWRLPETRLCFTPPDADVDVSPLPALANGHITFGCFQNPNKINDALVALWAGVLKTVSGSRLLLKARLFDDSRVRESMSERFAGNGIDASRLIFEAASPRVEYLKAYQRVDIVLDSFPFPGGTTTVESLWMGVPVLTLAGSSFLARQGVGFLMNAGLPDWIAADADDYVARAAAHASDLPRLAALRKGLRQQVLDSPIFDAPRFAGHFEAALRGMWQIWCSTRHVAPSRQLPQVEIDQLFGMFTAGRFPELEARTRLLIDRDPDLGMAWKLLGASLQVQGKDALPALQRAAELLPNDAEAHNNLGIALVVRGDNEGAIASFHRALAADTDSVAALRSLGMILKAVGRTGEAVSCLRRALQINPDDADMHSYLGSVLMDLGQLDEAVASYRRALAIRPDFVEAHTNMGVALQSLGQFDQAVASYRRALEIDPEFAGAHTNLGVSLASLGQFDEAAARHRRAVEIDASNAMAHYNLAVALQALGQFAAAVASYRRALQINPGNADAHLRLGDVLNELGQPRLAFASYRSVLEIKPDLIDAHSNLLFTQHYLPDQSAEAMLAQARRYADIVGRQARQYTEWSNIPADDRRLRVGLVSGDLRDHPVGHFIEGVLSALCLSSSERLSLVAYANQSLADELTERIKASCDIWRSVAGISDENLARQIRDDGIDILIDLSGHTGHNCLPLFAWKPAPVQISWLGYFATTGLKAMDYLIADPWTLPESEEVNFTEKIWRLPETRLCFTPPKVDVEVAPLPALANGHISFGCFHALNKINDAVVLLWARVLKAVPESRLLLKTKLYDDANTRQNLAERFAGNGIDASRLIFEGASPRAEYLAAYQRVDIVLDTFPYPGGTTTVESLWMGVPVLTLAGTSFLARQGVGFLMNAGLPDWIAADADDYVARAVAHAGDLQRLTALRKGLRQQVLDSPIFDAARFAGNFEAALRGMWHAWCSRRQMRADHEEFSPIGVARLFDLFNMGRYSEVETRTRSLIDQEPEFGIAWKLLGASLQGQGKDALPALQQAAKLLPDDAEAHNNLGVALVDHGKIQDAIASFHRALEIKPDYAGAHCSLGSILSVSGYLDDAVSSLRRALQIDPGFGQAHCNLGTALQALGQIDDAVASYGRAIEINPDDADAHNNLGVALKDLGRFHEAAASYSRALAIKPDYTEAYSNLLFSRSCLSQECSASSLAEAQRFGDLVARRARPHSEWQNIPDPDRGLRVGLVSGDLRTHTVGRFIEGMLAALSASARGRLELIGYPTFYATDALTDRIKACCHGWHSAVGLSDEQLARQVRDDGIDILIDLSGHTAHNRLPMFAWKSAPVQVSWLGYFATTGVKAIDYLIADPWTLPESEEVNFTEKIWRLPETRLCFTPPEEDTPIAPPPALANGYVTFGCSNNLVKVNDDVVTLWARVLGSVPGSRLMLKAKQLGDDTVRASILGRFASREIGADRLILEGPSPRSDYFAAYNRMDIALDPFPYTGGATTVESLWMGVPVLTLAGTSFLARQGVGLLMNAGLPDWVAADADDYVARAVAHASDLPRLTALRKGLRQQVLNSPIFDASRFADYFEAALRGMWREWCKGQVGATKQESESHPMKTFLHVGCGPLHKDRTTRGFNVPEWKELRLDINEAVNPDIVGTMLDMSAVADASVDALFSAHNIEHLYAHEVPLALAEFRRVLKPDGFVVITCPDLQSVCQLIAEDKLTEPAYNSPAGPISPIDILYGLRTSLQEGNHYMAHRCGFTEKVLVATLQDAGFGSVVSGSRAHPFFDLWAVASKVVQPEERLAELAEAHFPE
jgi:predicted O-linked N-acetylglucosamine transferase (SPINDLY family)